MRARSNLLLLLVAAVVPTPGVPQNVPATHTDGGSEPVQLGYQQKYSEEQQTRVTAEHAADEPAEGEQEGEQAADEPAEGEDEHEEGEPSETTKTTANLLLGFMVTNIILLRLVNWPDPNIRAVTWNIMSSTISIYLAVLLYNYLADQLLFLCLRERAHAVDKGMLDHVFEIGVRFLLFVSAFAMISLMCWNCANWEKPLYAGKVISGHILAFAGIGVVTSILELIRLAKGNLASWKVGVSLSSVLLILILRVIARKVRNRFFERQEGDPELEVRELHAEGDQPPTLPKCTSAPPTVDCRRGDRPPTRDEAPSEMEEGRYTDAGDSPSEPLLSKKKAEPDDDRKPGMSSTRGGAGTTADGALGRSSTEPPPPAATVSDFRGARTVRSAEDLPPPAATIGIFPGGGTSTGASQPPAPAATTRDVQAAGTSASELQPPPPAATVSDFRGARTVGSAEDLPPPAATIGVFPGGGTSRGASQPPAPAATTRDVPAVGTSASEVQPPPPAATISDFRSGGKLAALPLPPPAATIGVVRPGDTSASASPLAPAAAAGDSRAGNLPAAGAAESWPPGGAPTAPTDVPAELALNTPMTSAHSDMDAVAKDCTSSRKTSLPAGMFASLRRKLTPPPVAAASSGLEPSEDMRKSHSDSTADRGFSATSPAPLSRPEAIPESPVSYSLRHDGEAGKDATEVVERRTIEFPSPSPAIPRWKTAPGNIVSTDEWEEWRVAICEAEDEGTSIIFSFMVYKVTIELLFQRDSEKLLERPDNGSMTKVSIAAGCALISLALFARIRRCMDGYFKERGMIHPVTSTYKRRTEVVQITLGMTMSWLAMTFFHWFTMYAFHGIGHELGEIVAAAILTLCSIAIIFVLDWMGDLAESQDDSNIRNNRTMSAADDVNAEIGRAIRNVIASIALAVGLSWEKAFHASLSVVVESNQAMHKHYVIAQGLMALVNCLIIMPVWLYHVVPMATKTVTDHKQLIELSAGQ